MLEATALIAGAVPLSEQAGVALRPLHAKDCVKLARWWRVSVPKELKRYDRAGYFKRAGLASPVGMRKYWIKQASPLAHHRTILVGGKIAGYCGYNGHSEVVIFINPDLRGRGIGTKAMRLLLAEARGRNKKKLCVVTSRPDFWMKIGFKERRDHRVLPLDTLYGRIALVWGHWGGVNCGSA